MDKNIALRQVLIYFAITLGLSFFVFWGPLALFQVPTISFVSSTKGPFWAIILFILGGFVPSLVGICLTGLWEGRSALQRMGRRLVQFNIGWRWYLTAIGVIVFISLGQIITGRLLGISFDPSLFVQQLSSILPLIILGPLSEELGWRGYAQDRLQKVFDPALSGAILGILWALWHLPLFFMPGTVQHETGASFLPFLLTLMGLSVVFAWLHTQTGGSIWTAIFLHWLYTYASQVIFTGMGQNPVFNWLACIPYLIIAGPFFGLWKNRFHTTKLASRIKTHDVLAYFVLVYLISWGLWIPILVSLPSNPANQTFLSSIPPVIIGLVFLGEWAPAISAVVVTAITRGKAGLKKLFGGLLIWRVPVRWWLVVLLGWPALNLLPALVYAQINHQPISLNLSAWPMILSLPLSSVVLNAYYANEELGWRGFALPRLQEKHTALFSSILIGLAWACWHLPMFIWFIKGVSPSMPFYNFLIEVTSISILMTWIFNHTRGSVLVAIVFHLWHNFYPGYQNALLSNTDPNGFLEFRTWFIAAAAILVVTLYGYQRFIREQASSTTAILGASEG